MIDDVFLHVFLPSLWSPRFDSVKVDPIFL